MRERGTNVGHSQGGLPGREGTEDGLWRMTTNHQSERQAQRRGGTQSFQEGVCKGCGGQTKGQAGLLIHGGPQGRFYPRGSGEPGRALSRGIMSAEQTSSKMCPGDGTRFTAEGGDTTPERTPSSPGRDPDSHPDHSFLSEPHAS